MKGLKAFLEGLKVVKKIQKAIENLDDDIDGDGIPEVENLKEAFESAIKHLTKVADVVKVEAGPLADDVKKIVAISKRILEHLDD